MSKKILDDGSVEGQTFSGDKYTGDYPSPKKGETYADYRARVDQARTQGFHPGDLSDSDWITYCKGSGQYDDFDSNTVIQ